MVVALAGAVLCGGRSSRMGRDKALLPYLGTPMAVRVAEALRGGGCIEVVAVGGDAAGLEACALAVVADSYPGDGPLGGVITALRHFADHDAVFVAACDLPGLTPATVELVVHSLGDFDVAMAVGDREQPLCAAWNPRVVTELLRRFEGGERSMRGGMASLSVVSVAVPASDLLNVNASDEVPR